MPKAIEVIVTLDEPCMSDIPKAVDRLQRAGLDIVEVLEITGQVVGKWSKGEMKELRDVDGVLEAVASKEISLPPPDSDIQ